MALCQLFLQSEAAYACVSELGEIGLVQFRDLNPDVNLFQRKFVNEIRRCDEMERKLRYLEKEIQKNKVHRHFSGESPIAPEPREMIELEATFEKLENELIEVNQNAVALKRNFLELVELKHVLNKAHIFLDGIGSHDQLNLLTEDQPPKFGGVVALKLGFVTGVIKRDKFNIFEKTLWRACLGNVFVRQSEIQTKLLDPHTEEEVYKSVFIIFYQGDQLKTKVIKICEGYRATIYPCPENITERREMAVGVMTRIEDLQIVLNQTEDHRRRVLLAAAKNIKIWFIKVRKIKAIYHTLNMFNLDVTQKCLIAECWVPVKDLDKIHLALRRGTERSGSSVPPILNKMDTSEEPPTYNHVNKFTKGFQILIDSYGIASYQEMNPAPFTIVTFPFLFAVMFGDLGHGFILFLFASWMIGKERQLKHKSKNEIWTIFFGGRYIIFFMGIFSMYTGLIYNDIFAKSLNIFGSTWKVSNETKEYVLASRASVMLDPATNEFVGFSYPFGMDPVWQYSKNKIIFHNSFKMKISIILGVFHMLFGVIVSFFNHIHFKNIISIFCEFIPQLIFLSFLFLYMVILMFIKWIKYYASNDPKNIKTSTRCAPSILITFINMILNNHAEFEKECESPFMFEGQRILQQCLVICALVCVPWMLLAKPLLTVTTNKKPTYSTTEQSITRSISYETTDTIGMIGMRSGSTIGIQQVERDSIGELFIHQSIHTIEYVLGSVSHTASYLRLWALSLAHSQLSEVLWSMILDKGLTMTNPYIGSIALYIIFGCWAALTVSILVVMEGLSAFLHTLRLH
ncbi:V-type proton ATPase 116 kDa subunit a 1-like isoform X2 [Aethina tumida]|nr:V-type proton ATPase 116 kDa subunit a 1-like isoform X2 [Aethina tumida]